MRKIESTVSRVRSRYLARKFCVIIVLMFATYINESTSITNKTEVVENNGTSTVSTYTSSSTVATANDGGLPCIKPAILQFPPPLIGHQARKYGGILIFLAICVYSFIGLAITCDHYFVKSLDCICEELKLSADVAGATFMAAGSSAPELATVVIGVFLAQDDIGISGVIGSAVFNIMFVIAMCGLFATSTLYLHWWPLCRDCFFYYLSIIIMLIAISNEYINWFESSLLLITYAVYCVSLYFNERLENWVETLPPFNKIKPTDVDPKPQHEDPTAHLEDKVPTYDSTGDAVTKNGVTVTVPVPSDNAESTQYYKPKEHKDEINPLEMPVNASAVEYYYWKLTYPMHYLLQATTPDCKKQQYRHWYPVTFAVSMLWISFYSYIMVWMITVIGYTLGIPDTVMGLTFVAAGVSVPDALSSIAVVKEGYGDMAVSNAVGSNVFDILICLGVPWFLKTAILNPGSRIKVYSKGLIYSTISLLSTVVVLIFATHFNGWKLDKKYGFILLVGYFVFITLASLYELNVFGNMNPRECTLGDY